MEKEISIVYLEDDVKTCADGVEGYLSDRGLDWCRVVENFKWQDEDFLLYLLDNGEPLNEHTLD